MAARSTPRLEELGFSDVKVDDSDSRMEFDEADDIEELPPLEEDGDEGSKMEEVD